MAYSAGAFSFTNNAFAPLPVTGTTISSTAAAATWAELATALSTCWLRDGTQTATSAMNWGAFRQTNIGAATARTDAPQAAQVQDGGLLLVGSVAGTNTITGTLAPAITAYASGQKFQFVPAVTNTAATTINLNSVGAKDIFSGGVSLRGGELVAGIPAVIEYDGTSFHIVGSGAIPPMVSPGICEGRLTLTSGTPVTTTDVTAAETVYFTPFRGNKIALYTGATWKLYTFAELSVDVPDATAMNDVFIYDNAGTLTLDVTAWTNDTTRATALTTQNGIYVKTGATGRRYLGSFYATTAGNGQTEDSVANRYLFNYYNRARRQMRAVDGTNNWTYTLAAFQQANASAANQLNFVIGVSEDAVTAAVVGRVSNDNAGGGIDVAVGVGLDSTTVNSAAFTGATTTSVANRAVNPAAIYDSPVAVGRHFLAWLEYSTATGLSTWDGDGGAAYLQTGISGSVWA